MNEVKYAGFWIRFIAAFLDTLLVALPVGVIVYVLSDGSWFDLSLYQQNLQMAMAGNPHALDKQPDPSFFWELIFEISVFVVTIIFWEKWRGATPGKKLMRIKIIDKKTHKDISNKQAITRSLGYIPSMAIFFIGFLMVAFRKDKRALHDMLAGTLVVYNEESTSQP